MITAPPGSYAIDVRTCIRCAACSTVAPGIFLVKGGPARVRRAPQSPSEVSACEAARVLCPTQAIVAGEPGQPEPRPQAEVEGPSKHSAHPSFDELRMNGVALAVSPSEMAGAAGPAAQDERYDLYSPVMEAAEAVRWKVEELPWASFEPAQVTPGLRAVVHEMAYSEQTTFSATQKFMEAFGDDPDFSQWISVWFYEETRHPLVLIKWLALAGEAKGKDFVLQGRASQPFMKSRTGTLVTNIISEMVAADAYLQLANGKVEPLLTAVVARLAADEARHGASFFAFARRMIAAATQPDRERMEALKVLHFWFNASTQVNHPVNEAMDRMKKLLPSIGAPPLLVPYDRIARIVGELTGLPIRTAADIAPQLSDLARRLHPGL